MGEFRKSQIEWKRGAMLWKGILLSVLLTFHGAAASNVSTQLISTPSSSSSVPLTAQSTNQTTHVPALDKATDVRILLIGIGMAILFIVVMFSLWRCRSKEARFDVPSAASEANKSLSTSGFHSNFSRFQLTGSPSHESASSKFVERTLSGETTIDTDERYDESILRRLQQEQLVSKWSNMDGTQDIFTSSSIGRDNNWSPQPVKTVVLSRDNERMPTESMQLLLSRQSPLSGQSSSFCSSASLRQLAGREMMPVPRNEPGEISLEPALLPLRFGRSQSIDYDPYIVPVVRDAHYAQPKCVDDGYWTFEDTAGLRMAKATENSLLWMPAEEDIWNSVGKHDPGRSVDGSTIKSYDNMLFEGAWTSNDDVSEQRQLGRFSKSASTLTKYPGNAPACCGSAGPFVVDSNRGYKLNRSQSTPDTFKNHVQKLKRSQSAPSTWQNKARKFKRPQSAPRICQNHVQKLKRSQSSSPICRYPVQKATYVEKQVRQPVKEVALRRHNTVMPTKGIKLLPSSQPPSPGSRGFWLSSSSSASLHQTAGREMMPVPRNEPGEISLEPALLPPQLCRSQSMAYDPYLAPVQDAHYTRPKPADNGYSTFGDRAGLKMAKTKESFHMWMAAGEDVLNSVEKHILGCSLVDRPLRQEMMEPMCSSNYHLLCEGAWHSGDNSDDGEEEEDGLPVRASKSAGKLTKYPGETSPSCSSSPGPLGVDTTRIHRSIRSQSTPETCKNRTHKLKRSRSAPRTRHSQIQKLKRSQTTFRTCHDVVQKLKRSQSIPGTGKNVVQKSKNSQPPRKPRKNKEAPSLPISLGQQVAMPQPILADQYESPVFEITSTGGLRVSQDNYRPQLGTSPPIGQAGETEENLYAVVGSSRVAHQVHSSQADPVMAKHPFSRKASASRVWLKSRTLSQKLNPLSQSQISLRRKRNITFN